MDREKVIKWLEYDYLPRVGAYRKDCKQGCDACMPMHDGEYYCDIDMLWEIFALLNEKEAVKPKSKVRHGANAQIQHFCGNCNTMLHGKPKYCPECGKGVLW